MIIDRFFNLTAIKIGPTLFLFMLVNYLLAEPAYSQEQIHNHSHDRGGFSPKASHEKSLNAMTDNADLILVGSVTGMRSEWDENKTSIRTIVSISNGEVLKGTSSAPSVTLITPGGEVNDVGELYSHTAQFKKEEDVIVFLKKNKRGEYIMSDGERAKYSIVQDKQSGKKFIPNIGSLETFRDRIKYMVKENKQQKTKR